MSGVALLSATLNQCKKPNQQLLILITVWIGMEQAFIGADFTQVMETMIGASIDLEINFEFLNCSRLTSHVLWVSIKLAMS